MSEPTSNSSASGSSSGGSSGGRNRNSNLLLVRSKDGVELFDVPTKSSAATERSVQATTTSATTPATAERPFLLKGATTLQHYAPDGSCVYLHQPSKGVVKCPLDARTNTTAVQVVAPFLKDSTRVQMLASSPKGTYLVTWERLSATDPATPNLKIWDSETGNYLHGFVQKNLRREGWPYIHWSHDEKYAFLMVTNEIRVYEGHIFATLTSNDNNDVRFVDKMRCPGITAMSVPTTAANATTDAYLVSSFVPATKDKPARASLHQYPSASSTTVSAHNATNYPSLVTKTLFQAEEVTVHWSPKGDAALMALQTSIDTSGESYYGSTTLHLMTAAGLDGAGTAITVSTTGPVLDVAWMPNPSKAACFAVIHGRMPAMASLHHGSTGEATFLFGNAHRNTICWSQQGRFVNLAGFGNLAGGMTFWDRNKFKAVPQYDAATGVPIYPALVASCTVGYGWSPDGRCFGVSTTSPRMNVDNGIRVYRYNGELLTAGSMPWNNAHYQPDRLLQASFVPALLEVHPDRAQSPAPRLIGTAEDLAAAKKRASVSATQPAAPTTKRYVPPSARGGGGRSGGAPSLAERMRRETIKGMTTATVVTNKPRGAASVVAGKVMPVGMAAQGAGEGKSKMALRREKQKLNKAKQEREEAAAKIVAEAAAKEAQQQPVEPEKRAKKLKKQLRQIDDLKTKDELNEDQQKKVDSEPELRAELAGLGL